ELDVVHAPAADHRHRPRRQAPHRDAAVVVVSEVVARRFGRNAGPRRKGTSQPGAATLGIGQPLDRTQEGRRPDRLSEQGPLQQIDVRVTQVVHRLMHARRTVQQEGRGRMPHVAGPWQTATTRARVRLARRGIGPGRAFESRVTWILGSPRSGSTWLLVTLGALPGVVPINEPLIGEYLGDIVCDYRGIGVEGLDVSNFTFERQRRHVADQFFSPAYRDVW